MNRMKGFIIIITVLAGSSTGLAQPQVLDSLKQVLQVELTADTTRVQRLHQLASMIYRRNPKEAQPYLFEALNISSDLREGELIGTSNRLLGVTYAFLGNRDSALIFFQDALSEFENIQDQRGMATTNQAIGTIFAMQGKFENAISNILAAIPYFESIGDSNALGVSYFNIANMYGDQGLYEEALERYEKASEIYVGAGLTGRMPRVYTALIKTNVQMGNADKALEYLDVGISSAEQVNDMLSLRNMNLDGSRIYLQKEEYEKARFHTEQALDLNRRTGADPILAANINQQLAIIEFKTGRVATAKRYIEQVLENEVVHEPGTEGLKVSSLVLYSDIEAAGGNGIKAHSLIKEAKAISDSLTKEENAKAIAELETIYETEKKENQIQLLEAENETAQLRLVISLIVSILVIGSIVAGFVISARKRAEKRKKEVDELKRELDNYGNLIAEKNKFMEQVSENLEELKIDAKSFQTQKGLLSIVDSLSQNIQLTDQEEKLFKRIDQVNKGFFLELRKRSDEITQHDERLASLVQMGLSNKEIGPILGISPKSVNQARYRLKKKLNLQPEVELADFLKKIAA